MRAKAAKICTDTSIIAFAYSYDDLRLRVLELSQVKLIVANIGSDLRACMCALRVLMCQVVGAAVRAPEPALRSASVRLRVLRATVREWRQLSRTRETASAPRIEVPPLRRAARLSGRGSRASTVPIPAHYSRSSYSSSSCSLCLFVFLRCVSCFCVSFPLLLSLDMRTYTM